MYAKSLVFAAALAAVAGVGGQAHAQYAPMVPYGGYGYPMMPPPGMPSMSPAMLPGMPGVVPANFAGAAEAGPGCTDGACTGKGSGCGCDDCKEGWCHRISVFGEFLYMRPRNAEVAYAVPIDGTVAAIPTNPAYPVGPVQVVDPDFQPGFRFGAGITCDECSQIVMTYSQLDADANDNLVVPGGTNVVARSLVSPPILNAAIDTLDAEAHLFVQFKTLDIDYKSLFAYNCDFQAAYVFGVRYAKLNQEFNALYLVNGFETVETDVEFEGVGLRAGLEAERYGRNRQWFVYGKGSFSLVGGESRADYFGTNQADALVVDTDWEAGRLVTITDFEVGLGWQNCCGNFRLSAGYAYSLWGNIVRTNEWIDAVQLNNYTDRTENFNSFMTFDGITARAEFRW
jgi:hypothetical protein